MNKLYHKNCRDKLVTVKAKPTYLNVVKGFMRYCQFAINSANCCKFLDVLPSGLSQTTSV